MMKEQLLDFHKTPIDIYSEKKELQRRLEHERNIALKEQEKKYAETNVDELRAEQIEIFKNQINDFKTVAQNCRDRIANAETILQKYYDMKIQIDPKRPDSQHLISMIENAIINNQRLIDDDRENADKYERIIAMLESEINGLSEADITDVFLLNMLKTYENYIQEFNVAIDNFTKLRDDFEVFNVELRQKIIDYPKLLEEGNVDCQSLLSDYTKVSQYYFDLFSAMTIDLPTFFQKLIPQIQRSFEDTVSTIQSLNKASAWHSERRDNATVNSILEGVMGKYMEGDIAFINHLTHMGAMADADMKYVCQEVQGGKVKDRGVNALIQMLKENYEFDIDYIDAFKLRLLLIEYYKVVELSTKNNKLDYVKNYYDQYQKLAAKAKDMNTTISPAFKNPIDLKIDMIRLLTPYTDYVKSTLEELLDTTISRLPSIQ